MCPMVFFYQFIACGFCRIGLILSMCIKAEIWWKVTILSIVPLLQSCYFPTRRDGSQYCVIIQIWIYNREVLHQYENDNEHVITLWVCVEIVKSSRVISFRQVRVNMRIVFHSRTFQTNMILFIFFDKWKFFLLANAIPLDYLELCILSMVFQHFRCTIELQFFSWLQYVTLHIDHAQLCIYAVFATRQKKHLNVHI
jgi:hypothetical protein